MCTRWGSSNQRKTGEVMTIGAVSGMPRRVANMACLLFRWLGHGRSRLRRGGEGAAIGSVTETSHVVALVDASTGRTHLVRDDALVAGRLAGRYVAVCEAVVLAASLTAPGDTYCRLCANRVKR